MVLLFGSALAWTPQTGPPDIDFMVEGPVPTEEDLGLVKDFLHRNALPLNTPLHPRQGIYTLGGMSAAYVPEAFEMRTPHLVLGTGHLRIEHIRCNTICSAIRAYFYNPHVLARHIKLVATDHQVVRVGISRNHHSTWDDPVQGVSNLRSAIAHCEFWADAAEVLGPVGGLLDRLVTEETRPGKAFSRELIAASVHAPEIGLRLVKEEWQAHVGSPSTKGGKGLSITELCELLWPAT